METHLEVLGQKYQRAMSNFLKILSKAVIVFIVLLGILLMSSCLFEVDITPNELYLALTASIIYPIIEKYTTDKN